MPRAKAPLIKKIFLIEGLTVVAVITKNDKTINELKNSKSMPGKNPWWDKRIISGEVAARSKYVYGRYLFLNLMYSDDAMNTKLEDSIRRVGNLKPMILCDGKAFRLKFCSKPLNRSYGISSKLLNGLTCSSRFISNMLRFARSSNLNMNKESIKIISPAIKTSFKRLSTDFNLLKRFLKLLEDDLVGSIF